MNGLWIGKTGDGNAWYHIFPFAESKKTKKLHIVRYKYPQRKINNSNVEFHIFKSNGKFSEAFKLLITGFRVIKRNKIDYIVTFNLVPWGILAWFIAKLTRKPLIIGLIGSDFNKHINNKKNNLLKRILFSAEVVTVTGNRMMRYFSDTNKDKNVFIFPHCLPDEWFDSKVNSNVDKCDLISISELKKNKRTIDIIRAVHHLKKQGIDLKLKILGVGPEKIILMKEISKLGLNSNVKLLGYQKDVLSHLNRAKFFIQASIKEGLSLSLIEALGAGVIPIVTEAGSEKDIITDKKDCLFFEKRNYRDLSKNIKYAMDSDNYKYLKTNVLKTRSKLSIQNAIFQTDEILAYIEKQVRINESNL